MYKIVFVVAVFAFVLQGACSGPVTTQASAEEVAAQNVALTKGAVAALAKAAQAPKPEEPTAAAAETDAHAPTEQDPSNGATSTNVRGCVLVLAASMALTVVHVCQ